MSVCRFCGLGGARTMIVAGYAHKRCMPAKPKDIIPPILRQAMEFDKERKFHARAYDILVKTWEGFGFSGGRKRLSEAEQAKLWNRLNSILKDSGRAAGEKGGMT